MEFASQPPSVSLSLSSTTTVFLLLPWKFFGIFGNCLRGKMPNALHLGQTCMRQLRDARQSFDNAGAAVHDYGLPQPPPTPSPLVCASAVGVGHQGTKG